MRTALSSLEAETRRHYDAHPLEYLPGLRQSDVRAAQPAPFAEFADALPVPSLVADIGCGPGRATMYLTQLGHATVALDISENSIALARHRAPRAHYVCASNMALPIGDNSFDAVISDGVIHHTPDARTAFRENARIVKPGGLLYLGVYNPRRHYFYFYTYLGPPIRWLAQRPAGRVLLNVTLMPLYYLVHLLKSHGRRTWRGAENFFYDYFVTPQVSFHTREEVEHWARATGLRLESYDPRLGNVHVFIFSKPVS